MGESRDLDVTVLLDTCVVIWLFGQPTKLSRRASAALDGGALGVPAVVVVELGYLCQRDRLSRADYDAIIEAVAQEGSPFVAVPLSLTAAGFAAEIPRAESTDPFDRMIAGTAMAAGLPLITADTKLPAVTGLDVIW